MTTRSLWEEPFEITKLQVCWADKVSEQPENVRVACDKMGRGSLGLCYEHEWEITGDVKDKIGFEKEKAAPPPPPEVFAYLW